MTGRHFLVCGIFGALAMVAAFALGTALLAATGTPMIGGLINAVVVVLIMMTGVRVANRFGAATLINFVFMALAIPTLTGGPPGPHKVAVGLVAGFVIDLIISALRRKDLGYFLGGFFGAVVYPLGVYVVLIITGAPASGKYRSLLIPFVVWYGISGVVGTYLALVIYRKKLKTLTFVRGLEESK